MSITFTAFFFCSSISLIEQRAHSWRASCNHLNGCVMRAGAELCAQHAIKGDAVSGGGRADHHAQERAYRNQSPAKGGRRMEFSLQANVRLGSAKADLLLAVVYSLYRTLREAERWPAILQQIQELLGGQACSLSIHDFRTRTGAIAIHSGCFDDEFLHLYEERYAAQDPWLKREEHHRSVGATWVGDELVPRAQLMATECYQRWL